MTVPHLWQLDRFVDAYEFWASEQGATPELRHVVGLWIFSRMEDPYQGVERQADIAPEPLVGHCSRDPSRRRMVRGGLLLLDS
jgi:hypothetical protein